jgi:deoxyribonuclease V
MIAALDVFYANNAAQSAAVIFDGWRSTHVLARYTAAVSPVANYEPGQFYLRELSPLLVVIQNIQEPIDTYVIDGYCHLSSDLAPGLGAHLSQALRQSIAVVGVAKNRYRQSTHAVEVCRGDSKRPLFVTSIGLSYDIAGADVASMAGPHRIPQMLKAVDCLSRAAGQSYGRP